MLAGMLLDHARIQLGNVPQYSREWIFWRGVAVCAEAIYKGHDFTEGTEWFDALARLAKESKET